MRKKFPIILLGVLLLAVLVFFLGRKEENFQEGAVVVPVLEAPIENEPSLLESTPGPPLRVEVMEIQFNSLESPYFGSRPSISNQEEPRIPSRSEEASNRYREANKKMGEVFAEKLVGTEESLREQLRTTQDAWIRYLDEEYRMVDDLRHREGWEDYVLDERLADLIEGRIESLRSLPEKSGESPTEK